MTPGLWKLLSDILYSTIDFIQYIRSYEMSHEHVDYAMICNSDEFCKMEKAIEAYLKEFNPKHQLIRETHDS